jgi:hypothetical protein
MIRPGTPSALSSSEHTAADNALTVSPEDMDNVQTVLPALLLSVGTKQDRIFLYQELYKHMVRGYLLCVLLTAICPLVAYW